MKVEELRKLYYLKPFEPFVVQTKVGRSLVVLKQEYMGIMPNQKDMGMYDHEDTFHRIALKDIQSLLKLNSKGTR
jgi:hypothetical protein